MLGGELIPEVQGLLRAGVPRTAKPFESIGYRQALAIEEGRMTFDEGLEEMRRDTRRYAKRQMTWWRREADLQWVSGFGKDEGAMRSVMNTVAEYLSSFG